MGCLLTREANGSITFVLWPKHSHGHSSGATGESGFVKLSGRFFPTVAGMEEASVVGDGLGGFP